MTRCTLLTLLCLTLAAPALRAEFTSQDRIQALYSPMFGFTDDNIPVVRVGIASGREEVRLTTRGPVRVYAGEAGGLEWRAAQGTSITVRRLTGDPARVVYRVGVERLKPGDFEVLRARVNTWKALGYQVKPVEVGRIFGYFGKMFDNRAVELVVLRDLPDEKAARSLMAQVAQASPGAEPFLLQAMETYPTGEMEVRAEGLPGVFRSTSVVALEPLDGAVMGVSGVTFGGAYSNRESLDLTYSGSLYVTFDRHGTLALVNVVDSESLIKGVVAGEVYASAPLEALKAQAVTARGEILSKMGLRHGADPFHICADVHCQVYKGSGKRTPAIDRAVEETRGEMLFSGGDLVPAFYHSDSGGMTEANQNAWPEQKPEPTLVCAPDLPGVPPGFEHGVPPDRVAEWLANPPRAFQSAVDWARGTFRWTRDVPRRDLEARLPAVARSPKGGRLDKLEVTRRGCSGRALAMTFTVNGKPFEVQGELVLRRLLGGDKALKSSLIVIDDRGDTLHVTGGGFGHGVGMSQMGAIGRAQAGQTYREILRAYYTGAGIEKIY